LREKIQAHPDAWTVFLAAHPDWKEKLPAESREAYEKAKTLKEDVAPMKVKGHGRCGSKDPRYAHLTLGIGVKCKFEKVSTYRFRLRVSKDLVIDESSRDLDELAKKHEEVKHAYPVAWKAYDDASEKHRNVG